MLRFASGATVVRIRCRISLVLAMMLALAFAAPAVAADAPEKVFDLSITAGSVPAAQRTLRAQKDQLVRWRVTSDVPGELHLHAYRINASVIPGSPAEIAFKAFATGRFRVEWHPAPLKPAGAAGHHAAPLVTFEVRPR